jgi:hypothetical protein
LALSSFGRFVLSFLGLCLISPLLAQTTGDIRGIVKDPSGAVVPGAKVTASIANSGIERKATSTDDGEFTIPTVPVGTYSVRVEATGFKAFQQDNVIVDIGHVAQVTASLQLGESTQVVTAEASAPLVETTSTQLGRSVTAGL